MPSGAFARTACRSHSRWALRLLRERQGQARPCPALAEVREGAGKSSVGVELALQRREGSAVH